MNQADQPEESSVPDPVVDGRVDWSQTFAGIEQPNEAYSLVMKKNKAYEKVNKRSRQERPPHPVAELEGPHEYEEIVPRDGVSVATSHYVNVQM